jgi:Asp-tRNA(Asn)/Glu-tRNA(Gln) amidotransferase C subunit
MNHWLLPEKEKDELALKEAEIQQLQRSFLAMIGWAETLHAIFETELAHNTRPEAKNVMRDTIDDLTDDLATARELRDVCKNLAEVRQLVDEVADWRDTQKRIMAEDCAPDEQHCTCVPVLRREIERLRDALASVLCSDNWISIPDDQGKVYWLWDGDGEPWEIARAVIDRATTQHDAPAAERTRCQSPYCGQEAAGTHVCGSCHGSGFVTECEYCGWSVPAAKRTRTGRGRSMPCFLGSHDVCSWDECECDCHN